MKLVAAKASNKSTPAAQRRTKVLVQLDEQLALAAAQARGESYAATRTVVVRDKATGASSAQTRTKRIKQWWFTSDTGRVCLHIRYGNRVLDLAKGKNSVPVCQHKPEPIDFELMCKSGCSGDVQCQSQPLPWTLWSNRSRI